MTVEITTPEHIRQEYWTESELAAELNKDVRTLRHWNNLRIGPPRTKLGGRSIYYRKTAVFRWLVDEKEQKPLLRKSRRKTATAHALPQQQRRP